MAPITADCYQLSLNGRVGTKTWTNVFHCELLGGSPPAPIEAAEALYEAYNTAFAARMQLDFIYSTVSYVDLRTLDGDSGTWDSGETHHGTGTGNAAPIQVSALLAWSATGGRRSRNGRTYLPGIDESSIDSQGALNSTVQGQLTTACGTFMTELTDADLGLCIVSVVGSSTTGTVRTITGGTCQLQSATQRRRNRH